MNILFTYYFILLVIFDQVLVIIRNFFYEKLEHKAEQLFFIVWKLHVS